MDAADLSPLYREVLVVPEDLRHAGLTLIVVTPSALDLPDGVLDNHRRCIASRR